MSLGRRIADLRSACGMSQYQLAKIMDVSRQAVSKWENDISAPDAIRLIKLSDVLETDVEYLSTGRSCSVKNPLEVPAFSEIVDHDDKKLAPQEVIEKVVVKPVVRYFEKPVIKKVYRKIYIRNPVEFIVCGIVCSIIGFLLGLLF